VASRNTLFYVNPETQDVLSIQADNTPLPVLITGKLAATRIAPKSKIGFNGCSDSQQSDLRAAASDAQKYAAASLSSVDFSKRFPLS
jgi:hypothetical protein